ncbi:MAG TPA: fumarylacetoacetate hydrolase family protein [Burkholderiaceae bacterium]|nr:fumarylacetoacetate hydrolase family protein [Burkholderiaceae bacterium]
MKLLRYGPEGHELPGVLDEAGQIRDLSGIVDHIDAAGLAPASLQRLRQLKIEALPKVPGKPRLGVPYVGISKFIGIGLNYADHAAECGLKLPKEPIPFNKWTTCITGPSDDIVLPRGSTKTDWEVELGVVIGQTARYVEEAEALNYVAGYCTVCDISERNFQIERGGQWDRGKGCDSFGPIGPYLVTADEVPNPQALDLWLSVDGQRMQSGNTRTMIFGVAHLVAYLSQFMTLLPGDIIATGTPPGVGMARKPPRFLQAGNRLRLSVQGLGEQVHTVRASD